VVCILKDINIAYKMDENDLNVHTRLFLGYGVKNKMSMSLAMEISLKPLFTISTNYTSGFLNYFHHQESGLLVIVQINTCPKK
jgi:hypothetical protein